MASCALSPHKCIFVSNCQDIAHLFRVATRQHLGHQVIVVGCLITRMGALEWGPVIGKDPLEDTPVSRELCHHRVAPSWGDDLFAVKWLYHGFPASSTPHRPVPGYPPPASFILEYGDFRDWENAFSYTIKINYHILHRAGASNKPALD